MLLCHLLVHQVVDILSPKQQTDWTSCDIKHWWGEIHLCVCLHPKLILFAEDNICPLIVLFSLLEAQLMQ